MQTSNGDQDSSSNNQAWYLIAEYPFRGFLSDHDKQGEGTSGLLLQTMRELGIPLAYLEKINVALNGFAEEASLHFQQGSLELPGRIRVFCQQRMLGEANSAKTRPVYAEQTAKHAPIKYHSSTIIKGGWGYFIIERYSDDAGSPEITCPFVDLYLYKEGE